MATAERPLVVITDYVTEPGAETTVLADHAQIAFAHATSDTDVAERFPQAAALIAFHDIQITGASVGRFPTLKGIVRCGVGYDNVDIRAAGERGIVVCNIPDYGTEDVADHALMMLLAIARRLRALDEDIRSGGWDASLIFGAPRLRGRTLGILGCGNIGTAMALRAKSLGMRILIYDPYKPVGYEKAIGVERAYSLDDFLPRAEFVSIHTPLTAESRHILNADTMGRLPKGAYIVNTARGPCVDAEALLQALEDGQIQAAALDVVEREPLDDDRLRRHPRVLLTPHAAYYSTDGFVEMRRKAGEEVARMLRGEPVRNPVNRAWLMNPRCPLPKLEG